MGLIDIPTGKRLEGPGVPDNFVGELRTFQRASEDRVALARKNLREYAEDELRFDGLSAVDRETLEEYEIPVSFVDLSAPGQSGVVAFTVRGGGSTPMIVPLRPRGAAAKVESVELGVMRGGRA
jgi:hypothetical protein